MKAGSFVPEQNDRVLYAMAGDDCSLHHDLEALTPKQQGDHRENQILTCALQVALIGLGKAIDRVALAEEFQEHVWGQLLKHYRGMFSAMGLETVQTEGLEFHGLDTFYESLAANPANVDLINLYMVSGSNTVLHESQKALSISRNVNSKIHFAEHAPAAGIPVPKTFVVSKGSVHSGEVDGIFTAHPKGLMVKLLGLAGARNVFRVASLAECKQQIAEYPDDSPVLLQEILDIARWREMTVDLTVRPETVEISNVRQILFAEGKWVGNFMSPELPLTAAHRAVLERVGAYAREQGYVAEQGVNCGIDYFIDGDDVIVTEINARWTGGLFPAEFLRRLAIRQTAVAFFDVIRCDAAEALQAFQRQHLYAPGVERAFGYVPMGFTPFRLPVEGVDCFFVWQVVVGDFSSFVTACEAAMPPGCFVTARAIRAEALS